MTPQYVVVNAQGASTGQGLKKIKSIGLIHHVAGVFNAPLHRDRVTLIRGRGLGRHREDDAHPKINVLEMRQRK